MEAYSGPWRGIHFLSRPGLRAPDHCRPGDARRAFGPISSSGREDDMAEAVQIYGKDT
jgi:hypothetical protein